MTDEKYTFVSDVAEKKSVARNAKYRRTHNGKGGRVKFPSDNLTRKELNAMNGEVKSYKLNEPMSWKEFKAMPDDIKIAYIKALRNKYNVPTSEIATDLFNVAPSSVFRHFALLGLNTNGESRGRRKWDSEGWIAWCNGIPVQTAPEEPVEKAKASLEEIAPYEPVTEQNPNIVNPDSAAPVQDEVKEKRAIPTRGALTFCGSAQDALGTMIALLSSTNVRITVEWSEAPEGDACG